MIKKPSAFLPIAMSLLAMAFVLGHIAIFGAAREADEGTTAHLFQILMAGQVPIVVFFAMRWLPRAPREGSLVLAAQLGAAAAAVAPVYLLGL